MHGSHSHGAGQGKKAFALGAGLNLAFVLAEVVFAFHSNSMALLSDAGHNLGDVLGLGAAWTATILAQKAPTVKYTYGFGSSSILAALTNAVLLLVTSGAIIWGAVSRLIAPQPVESLTVIIVAGAGIAVNATAALLFMRGREHDLNIRGAFMHMAADAALSAGVAASGALMLLTGIQAIDPAVSLIVAGLIVWSTWGLLREAMRLAMQGVPAGIDPDAVRAHLAQLSEVANVHDLHIWPLSTTETALTCHLVMKDGRQGDAFLESTAHGLHVRFGIEHATIQLEETTRFCGLECDRGAKAPSDPSNGHSPEHRHV